MRGDVGRVSQCTWVGVLADVEVLARSLLPHVRGDVTDTSVYGCVCLCLQTSKYWRARFFLLPCNSKATKRIIDGADRYSS